MLIKGDKIKLIKPMGCFDNIGEVCEVVNISEDAVISFKFGKYHMGCMSYNEYEKYFEKVANVKHNWTKWTDEYLEYNNLNNENMLLTVKFRHNGSKVQVKYNGLKARSSCYKDDIFELNKGLKIANARLIVKLLDHEVKEMVKNM